LEELIFKCKNCGGTVRTSDERIPICCNKPMERLSIDICTQPAHAEHARPMEEEDACDDGRAG
jgi:hypothetical protein